MHPAWPSLQCLGPRLGLQELACLLTTRMRKTSYAIAFVLVAATLALVRTPWHVPFLSLKTPFYRISWLLEATTGLSPFRSLAFVHDFISNLHFGTPSGLLLRARIFLARSTLCDMVSWNAAKQRLSISPGRTAKSPTQTTSADRFPPV